MTENSERSLKWILIISLVMFFWQTWMTLLMTPGYYFTPDFWYYIRNVTTLSFIIPVLSATLHTADFWDKEYLYKISIGTFIVSMSLLFVTSLSWISVILGASPF
ncbi:MAG: hypothetical protein JSV58_06675 [Candidatus Bathyarchaeota archaeon]|nr:MAG: hypothetical protein JSV58_06675 [Candidatus Bathyarchaeota archaeon]